MKNDIISYIVRFLIGGNATDDICAQVGYTADPDGYARYKVVIVPSAFFREDVYGQPCSLPSLPLNEIEGVPLLYGMPKVDRKGDTLVVYADIIAGAFFLITRYEEMVRCGVRDMHGRFPGRESLPCRAGFIDRPVVDEYGRLLRQWLRRAGTDVPEPERKIKKVYLTHDIDVPLYCRTLQSFLGRVARGGDIFRLLGYYCGPLEKDPNFTYPFMIKEGNALREAVGDGKCGIICFFKPGGKHKYDKPHYKINSGEIKKILRLLSDNRIAIGLHAGYESGLHPERIAVEKQRLEQTTGEKALCNRHHFLASREPEDMEMLEKQGITDDFTMGYADVAGFRLGTSRPVRWIDPVSKKISKLTLHPLTVMEHTLDNKKYMGLNYEGALEYCLKLIARTEQAGGEVVLLWHNEAFNAAEPTHYAPWQTRLYKALLDDLHGRMAIK